MYIDKMAAMIFCRPRGLVTALAHRRTRQHHVPGVMRKDGFLARLAGVLDEGKSNMAMNVTFSVLFQSPWLLEPV